MAWGKRAGAVALFLAACALFPAACRRTHDAGGTQPGGAFERMLLKVLACSAPPRPFGRYEPGTDPERMVYVARVGGHVRYAAVGTAEGYQSEIKVLVSVEGEPKAPLPPDPTVFRMVVMSSAETEQYGERINELPPGAGEECVPPFQLQFWGKRLSELKLEPAAAGKGIAAVTGATLTCRAVVEATRSAIHRIMAQVAQTLRDANTSAQPDAGNTQPR